MTLLPIALAQIDVQLGDPDANFGRVARLAAMAAAEGARLLVLPELWSTGYDLARADVHATSVAEGMFARVADLARQHQIEIVGSCLSRLGAGRYGNTAVYHDQAGRTQGVYTKTHLFRLMDEDQYLVAGDTRTLVKRDWGQVGLTICYDLRFPELFRAYALAGADVIIVPAEWPHPRLVHWQTLLRARAIENQVYIIACNRMGVTANTHFCGHSMVIDPWGEVIVEANEKEQLVTATLDLAKVTEVRSRIPVFVDRRPSVYE